MIFTIHKLINTQQKSIVGYCEYLQAFGKNKIIPYTKNNIEYIFNVDLQEDYCFIEVKHGKTDARDCFDKTENIFKDNILSEDMVHTDEQFFIFTAFNQDVSLLSEFNKKGVLLSFMKEKNINLKIVDVSSDIEKFAENVTKISSVKIKLTDNLFLQEYFTPKYNEDWDDKLPETCELKLKFNCSIDKKTIKNRFNAMKNDISVDDIEFEGEDAENRVLMINKKALLMKQSIEVIKEGGYYNADNVKRLLLELNQ